MNEVGDSGTFNVCGGSESVPGGDYVELKNIGDNIVDIGGWVLYDDKGSVCTYVHAHCVHIYLLIFTQQDVFI